MCSWFKPSTDQDTKEPCTYKAIPGIEPATCLYHTRFYITNTTHRARDVIGNKSSEAEFAEIMKNSKNIQSNVIALTQNPLADIKINL